MDRRGVNVRLMGGGEGTGRLGHYFAGPTHRGRCYNGGTHRARWKRVRQRLIELAVLSTRLSYSDASRARNPNRDIGYRRLKRQVVLPVACAICGEAITHFGHDGRSHTFDHITPWSEAPSNDPSNLRHAHKRCNSSRGRGPRVA
jgi:5-methylcytosine-specific restriction endonuclease McrA